MSMPINIVRDSPRVPVGLTTPDRPYECLIRKDSRGKYWVETICVAKGTVVRWRIVDSNGNPISPQPLVVLFFPDWTERPIHETEPLVRLDGKSGKYHYALFVMENGGYIGVEGNSSPEMIIQ
jgi:hypothetical protein